MFLEFICNLAVKFRNITLRNPETSLKKARNNPEKLRKNKKSAASFEDRTEAQRAETRRSIHYTVWGLENFRQKDNLSIDRSRDSSKAGCE